MKIKAYPKNKEHFIRLKKFGNEIKEICKESGTEPVAYGGLVYFGYTQDKNAVVHDIDFLVPEKYLEKIAERLKDKKIRYLWNHKRHDFKIYKKGAKVELDSIEEYPGKGKTKKSIKNFRVLRMQSHSDIKDTFDFNGLKVKAVSLDSLTNTYKNACIESHGKHEQHVRRYEALLKLKKA